MNCYTTYTSLGLGIIWLLMMPSLTAQVNDSLASPVSFYMAGERYGPVAALYWYPTSPVDWNQNYATGYTLTRTEIDSTGQTIGSPQPMGDAILPQDSLWFSENLDMVEGMIGALGALMYDTLFQFPPNELLDPVEMKYNYIVYEATQRPQVAVAVGLGFVDTTADPLKAYQYTVQNQDGDLQASLQFQGAVGRAFSDEFYEHEFQFPNDESFSDMLAAAFPIEYDRIVATSRGYGDSVVIRWGPSSPILWENAKVNGFEVYRDTGIADLKLLAVVKPWEESQITEDLASDSMALVAASILYGQKDIMTQQGRSAYDQMSISENNLGFALYAAERSALAGDILGFRYVDRDVPADSAYTYLISTPGLEDIWLTGKTSGVNRYQPTEAPSGFEVESGDGVITLVWDKEENRRRFSSYTIERSEDGQAYELLTPTNLVFIETDELPLTAYSYRDTTVDNDKTYSYRLRGFDSFAEVSDPVEVSGQALDLTPPPPVEIGFADYFEDRNTILVEWEEIGPPPADLSHYQVMMSDEPEASFGAISQKLSPTQDSFLLDLTGMDIDRGFFFQINSYDTLENVSTSYSRQVVVPDKVAPEAPQNLTGIVDSNSFVTLTWAHSASKDVTGYWLYWGNSPEEDLSPVNTEPLTTNYYAYYLDEVTLTKKIYFCVRAQDDSYNRGLPSELIEVKRLDYVPPITPYDVGIANQDQHLLVSWIPSPSDDVAGQLIYRRTDSSLETDYTLIDSLLPSQSSYLDTAVRIGQTYYYVIRAYDDSGNLSEESAFGTAQVDFPEQAVRISDLTIADASADSVELNWSFELPSVQLSEVPYTFEIHRAAGGQPLRLYQQLSADTLLYNDPEIEANVLYQYAIRVRFDNGWLGNFSEVKSVLTE